MARLNPIEIPSGVEINVSDRAVSIKGSKGAMEHTLHASVDVSKDDNVLTFTPSLRRPPLPSVS